uniref:Uncharacterized protein n=1 Tax=viral metagenome TaxID=1070528 RepID=A0A6M3L532_9ZZZZ
MDPLQALDMIMNVLKSGTMFAKEKGKESGLVFQDWANLQAAENMIRTALTPSTPDSAPPAAQ